MKWGMELPRFYGEQSSRRNTPTWPYLNLRCGLGMITILYDTAIAYVVWLRVFSEQVIGKTFYLLFLENDQLFLKLEFDFLH